VVVVRRLRFAYQRFGGDEAAEVAIDSAHFHGDFDRRSTEAIADYLSSSRIFLLLAGRRHVEPGMDGQCKWLGDIRQRSMAFAMNSALTCQHELVSHKPTRQMAELFYRTKCFCVKPIKAR